MLTCAVCYFRCLEDLLASNNHISELSTVHTQLPVLQVLDLTSNDITDWEEFVRHLVKHAHPMYRLTFTFVVSWEKVDVHFSMKYSILIIINKWAVANHPVQDH